MNALERYFEVPAIYNNISPSGKTSPNKSA